MSVQGETTVISDIPGHGGRSFDAHRILDRHKQVVQEFTDRLRALSKDDPVLCDLSLLVSKIVCQDFYLQVNARTKAGTATSCGFVGSDEHYLHLRKSRYAPLPDRFTSPDCDVLSFIICDELLHEAGHVLFLAQQLRGASFRPHTYFAEELSVTWWSAQVLNLVFGKAAPLHSLLNLNNDFLLSSENASRFEFWRFGCVFAAFYDRCSWLDQLVSYLPQRRFYIGERPDILRFFETVDGDSRGSFIFEQPPEQLRMWLRVPTPEVLVLSENQHPISSSIFLQEVAQGGSSVS